MKLSDWDILCKVANCEKMAELPIAFIIDSPWLPWWTGSIRWIITQEMMSGLK